MLGIVGVLLAEVRARAAPHTQVQATAIVAAAGLAAFSSLLVVHAVIHRAEAQRVADARRQVAEGAAVVRLQRLPFGSYVHAPDPMQRFQQRRFKVYYDLPPGVTIRPRR